MESLILKKCKKILRILNIWFCASKSGKLFNRITSTFAKAFPSSFLGKFLSKERNNYFRESLFCKLLMLPITLCRLIGSKISSFCHVVAKNSYLNYFFSNWHLVSTRVYGTFLMVYSLIYGIIHYFANPLSPIEWIILSCLFVLGFVLFLINRSLLSLFKGSFILKLFGGLFCDIGKDPESKLFLKDSDYTVYRLKIVCLVAALLAIITAALPIFFVILLLSGLLFCYFTFRYAVFGVYCVIIAAPFLPTMILVGLCLLCLIAFMFQVLVGKQKNIRPVPLGGTVAIFLFTMFLSAISSFTFVKSMQIIMIYLVFALFFYVSYQVMDSEKKWKGAIISLVITSAIVALYGVFQNFAGVNSTASWVDNEMFTQIKVRVYSTFDNPNVLGEYLVIMIPVVLAVLWKVKTDGQRFLYSFIFILLAMCMVFTWSRGAWLGVLLAAALFLLIADKRWAVVAVVGVMMLPLLLNSDSAIADRILSIGNTKDTSTAYRVSIWQASIHMIEDFWLSGIGSGSDAFSMIYPKYALSGANFALHSHNLFLQIMVEAGIIGLLSFIILILSFVKECLAPVVFQKRINLTTAVVLALCTGMLGFLFQGLTDNVWYNYKMVLIFWIVFSLATSAVAKDFNGGEHL